MSRSKLSDFKISGKLGSGSFGVVYLAMRHEDSQNYVIKNVNIGELSMKEKLDAIKEVKLLASINSDYVVKYFDSFVDENTLHIVMEYCDKGDLKGLLKKIKKKGELALSNSKSWSLFLQMALGLRELHKQKVLHRDMKTANVFLQSNPSSSPAAPRYLVKIGDLGVAKLLGTSSAFANTVVGTPYYLSPELCEDKPYNDKSDVWALGIILYECLTLEHPFEARNQCALILKIIKGQYSPIPPSHPADDGLRKLNAMCLTHDCSVRPNIAQILETPWVREKFPLCGLVYPEDLNIIPEDYQEEDEEEEKKAPAAEMPPREAPSKPESPPISHVPKSSPVPPSHNSSPSTPLVNNKNVGNQRQNNGNISGGSGQKARFQPRVATPDNKKYDKSKIALGPTPSVTRAYSPVKPQFSVNGIGKTNTPGGLVSKKPGVDSGVRGNRVRGNGAKQTSAVATSKHQRPVYRKPARDEKITRGTTASRAQEFGLGLGVVGIGSSSTTDLRNDSEMISETRSKNKLGDGKPANHERPLFRVVDGGGNSTKDDDDVSLPSTVDDEEEREQIRYDSGKEILPPDHNDIRGEYEGVQWEVFDADGHAKEQEQKYSEEFDHDIFNTGDYHEENGMGGDIDINAADGTPLYEAIEPPGGEDDFDEYEDNDDDLDKTTGDDENDEEEAGLQSNVKALNIASPQNSQPYTPRGSRVDNITSMRKHTEELGNLVRRGTRQCKKMLGTSFDELHSMFRDRFIGSDGRMKRDSEENEEKTMEMHECVGNMQDEIVEKCGGLMQACQAMFNIQRLLALEAGLAEAKKNLMLAESGQHSNEDGLWSRVDKIDESWETDKTEDAGDDRDRSAVGYSEESKEYEEESFEEYFDEEEKVTS